MFFLFQFAAKSLLSAEFKDESKTFAFKALAKGLVVRVATARLMIARSRCEDRRDDERRERLKFESAENELMSQLVGEIIF
jgi:hypothetical protein